MLIRQPYSNEVKRSLMVLYSRVLPSDYHVISFESVVYGLYIRYYCMPVPGQLLLNQLNMIRRNQKLLPLDMLKYNYRHIKLHRCSNLILTELI